MLWVSLTNVVGEMGIHCGQTLLAGGVCQRGQTLQSLSTLLVGLTTCPVRPVARSEQHPAGITYTSTQSDLLTRMPRS